MKIFVIAEDIATIEHGEETSYTQIYYHLGYFADHTQASLFCESMNAKDENSEAYVLEIGPRNN